MCKINKFNGKVTNYYSNMYVIEVDDKTIYIPFSVTCCWLEHNADCREYFGSIAGGSAYKFGLFQKKDTGEWMTGSPQKP